MCLFPRTNTDGLELERHQPNYLPLCCRSVSLRRRLMCFGQSSGYPVVRVFRSYVCIRDELDEGLPRTVQAPRQANPSGTGATRRSGCCLHVYAATFGCGYPLVNRMNQPCTSR